MRFETLFLSINKFLGKKEFFFFRRGRVGFDKSLAQLASELGISGGLKIKFDENYFFLENYVTSEGVVSHNVLYYQPLPITRYQVRFYANNYFE